MRYLRQSTSVDVPIGAFVDQTDGFTPETALTITQPDVRLKKNGGAWAQKNAAQTLSHEENGFYEVTLDTTDSNTLGLLRLVVAESGARIVTEDFMVISADEYDSLFTTTGRGEPGQEAPPLTVGWMRKIDYLYKFLRNRKQSDGSALKVYADDGTTVDHKVLHSEAGAVYEQPKVVSGP